MHTFRMRTRKDYFDSETDRFSSLLNLRGPIKLSLKRRRYKQYAHVYTTHAYLQVDCLSILKKANVESNADILTILQTIDEFLHPCGLSIDDFYIIRVDYCKNVYVVDDRIRACYCYLFNAMPLDTNYLHPAKDKDGNNKIFETSIYIKNQSRAFQVYDKVQERLSKNKNINPWEAGILREELQIKEQKLKNIGKSNPMFRDRSFETWINLETEASFLLNVCNIVPLSDFWSLEKAIELIHSSNNTKVIKSRLINYITAVNVEGSMDKGRAKIGISEQTENSYINCLQELNINPVTINARWGYTYLKNPLFNLSDVRK